MVKANRDPTTLVYQSADVPGAGSKQIKKRYLFKKTDFTQSKIKVKPNCVTFYSILYLFTQFCSIDRIKDGAVDSSNGNNCFFAKGFLNKEKDLKHSVIKGQFYQYFTSSFCTIRSQKCKKTTMNLGSARVKAAHKMLVKLTPEPNPTKLFSMLTHIFAFF